MTGFGRGESTSNQIMIKCEIKTLNSKFLDFSPRIPKELNDKEAEIRSLCSDALKRGKVMLTLDVEVNAESNQTVQVNESLFKAYYQKFKELSEQVHANGEGLLKAALESPEVIMQQETPMEDLSWQTVKDTVKEALDKCITFRKSEGLSLEKKLSEYSKSIHDGLRHIEQFDEKRTQNIRARLEKSMDEIRDKVKVDENRFEQELIFYLERLDISEEKVRLAQHLTYFEETLATEESAGKKLGFISQEIGREINTIGSKANDAEIQRTVVGMKDELEKIKEQVLNII